MNTSDVRPVEDLPDDIGKTAARALHNAGIDSLAKVDKHSAQEFLDLHGVEPKAINVLGEALAAHGRAFHQAS